MSTELKNKKLGLIGYGNIGKIIADLAQSIGMETTSTNSNSSDLELEILLKQSDVICVCAQLNKTTIGLLDKNKLALLSSNSYIVNVARGAIIDQKALIEILKNNMIAGAALDVFDGEPLTGVPNNEIIELAKLPNVLATPHTAGYTKESIIRLGDEVLQNIQACLKNEPTNQVN